MSEKKMVSRNIAIALGIICILLIAVIAYFSITGISAQNNYNNLQKQNKQFQAWLDGNITSYTSQINSLNSQITDQQSILDLQKQEVVVNQYSVNQGAGGVSVVVARSFLYSGYLHISSTSTTSSASITLQYWFGGKLYSSTQTVGTSGDILFAILKTDSATVYVGNSNILNGASHTITITYYY
jgi:hypothetical protein